jgi:GT2 family glycosyltransferase
MNCSDPSPEKKVSAIIASAGPPLGLWATIASCQLAGITDIHAVVPRKLEEPHDVMRSYGVNLYHFEETMIPPVARNTGASYASGDYLLFLDDHVVMPNMITQRIIELDKDILHFAYRPMVGPSAPTYYHFFGIRSMVDGDYAKEPLHPEPYRVGSFSHACFAVKREVWNSLGGYPLDWYNGFGGEEASFDLRAWAHGYEVWVDPTIAVHHFSARSDQRGYDKTIQPENYRRCERELVHDLPRLKERFTREGIPC